MFSTGQVNDTSVNYTNASAVCGFNVCGDNPTIPQNASNLSLPPNTACATPIGPKWVASLTNWLCFLIDGAGLQYRTGSVCQDPLLLLEAVQALIVAGTENVVRGFQTGQVGSPPPNGFAKDGDYALSDVDGNIYGPKEGGVWPSLPAYYGNNGAIGVSAANRINTYNCLMEMGPPSGAANYVTEMPTPVAHGNSEIILFNASNVAQTVHCDVGAIIGVGNPSADNPINLASGQLVVLRSDNSNWIIISNSISGGGYVLNDCNNNPIASGSQVVLCGDSTIFNPFTTTGVGAVMMGSIGSTGGGLNPSQGIHDFMAAGGAFTWGTPSLLTGTTSTYQQNSAIVTEESSTYSISISANDQRFETNSVPAGTWKVQTVVGIGGGTGSYVGQVTLLRTA